MLLLYAVVAGADDPVGVGVFQTHAESLGRTPMDQHLLAQAIVAIAEAWDPPPPPLYHGTSANDISRDPSQ